MYKLPTSLQVSLATFLAMCVILPGHVDAALKHRYSFNEGVAADASNRTIIDSVSGRNGVVLGAGSSASAGQLTLPGGASATQAYVDLPNGIVSSLTDATFEGWYTIDTAQAWGRVFDFGSTLGPGGPGTPGIELTGPGGGGEGQDYIFYAPSRGTNINQQRAGIRNFDPLFGAGGDAGAPAAAEMPTQDPNLANTLGTQRHVAVVYNSTGGSQAGMASLAVYVRWDSRSGHCSRKPGRHADSTEKPERRKQLAGPLELDTRRKFRRLV